MERKRRPLSLDKLLEQFFREHGQEQRFRELKVFEEWDKVLGEEIRENARPVSVNQGRLVVSVRNSIWLTELGFARQKLKSKLNRALGKGTIKDITFRIGPLEKKAGGKNHPEQIDNPSDPELAGRIEKMLEKVADPELKGLLKNWLCTLAEH